MSKTSPCRICTDDGASSSICIALDSAKEIRRRTDLKFMLNAFLGENFFYPGVPNRGEKTTCSVWDRLGPHEYLGNSKTLECLGAGCRQRLPGDPLKISAQHFFLVIRF